MSASCDGLEGASLDEALAVTRTRVVVHVFPAVLFLLAEVTMTLSGHATSAPGKLEEETLTISSRNLGAYFKEKSADIILHEDSGKPFPFFLVLCCKINVSALPARQPLR